MVNDNIPDLIWSAHRPPALFNLSFSDEQTFDIGEADSAPLASSPPCVRPAVCIHCSLMVADVPAPEIDPEEFGPPAPVRLKSIGCLCSLPVGWLRALVVDAERGRRVECGWQGRLLAALAMAGVPAVEAAAVAESAIPLRADLVAWAKAKLAKGVMR